MLRLTVKKGFTLIELLMVVIIIGVISAIALPRFNEAKVQAFKAATSADLRTLVTSMEMHYNISNTYPAINCVNGTSCTGLTKFTPSPDVRVRTAFGASATAGYYGAAAHSKVPAANNKCINMGDTANTAPTLGGSGFTGNNGQPPGSMYECSSTY